MAEDKSKKINKRKSSDGSNEEIIKRINYFLDEIKRELASLAEKYQKELAKSTNKKNG